GWGIGRVWPLLTGERAHYEMAAGRDVRPLIATIEKFATEGGMLPEQVWDSPDIPQAFMYFGRPAGSATPLMWAHAEYIKLLRSVCDTQLFDLIPIVAERYSNQRGRKDLEVWKLKRRVRRMSAGSVLRVLLPDSFRLRWSVQGGDSSQESASTPTDLGFSFVDIKTTAGQTAPVQFAFLATDVAVPQDVCEVQVVPTRLPA
ncbi:MAG: glycoside hydrolase family 15 protein, partial [Candidatus Angelobacter sp.]